MKKTTLMEFTTDPYGQWAHLRQEAPVCWSPGLSAWLVTSQQTANVVLSDRRFDPSAYERARPSPLPLPSSFELSDAQNTRLHRAVLSCLAVGNLRTDALAAAATTVLDRLLDGGGPDVIAVEWVSQVAEPIARAATQSVLGVGSGELDRLLALMAHLASDERDTYRVAASRLFTEAMLTHIAARRVMPAGDLLSELAQAWQHNNLRDEWLVAFLAPMLNALVRGFGGRLITHTAALLADHPHSQELIGAAGEDAARQAVLEAARLDPVNQSLWRRAREPVDLEGARIGAGDVVLVIVPAVCRDPAIYRDPDVFRLDRTTRSAAFGYGPHSCSGRDLAVAIAASTVCELLTVRGRRLRLDPGMSPAYQIEFGRSCVRLPLLLEHPARGDAPSLSAVHQPQEGAPWTTSQR